MAPFTAQDLPMLRGIASQYPEFIAWLERRRENWRDTLEQGGVELVRGRSLELKDVIAALVAAKNAR